MQIKKTIIENKETELASEYPTKLWSTGKHNIVILLPEELVENPKNPLRIERRLKIIPMTDGLLVKNI